MDPKLLTEAGWKTQLGKFKDKFKDTGLQGALVKYENQPQDKHAERLKALAGVSQAATSLKKTIEKDKTLAPVVAYLDQVVSAAAEQKKLLEAADAKTAAAAMTKAAAAVAEEATQGDYRTRILGAYHQQKVPTHPRRPDSS